MSEQETEKRLSAKFPDTVYNTLERLAKNRRKTMTAVLREAIALSEMIDDERKNGSRFLIEREGKMREIVFL